MITINLLPYILNFLFDILLCYYNALVPNICPGETKKVLAKIDVVCIKPMKNLVCDSMSGNSQNKNYI